LLWGPCDAGLQLFLGPAATGMRILHGMLPLSRDPAVTRCKTHDTCVILTPRRTRDGDIR